MSKALRDPTEVSPSPRCNSSARTSIRTSWRARAFTPLSERYASIHKLGVRHAGTQQYPGETQAVLLRNISHSPMSKEPEPAFPSWPPVPSEQLAMLLEMREAEPEKYQKFIHAYALIRCRWWQG